uniref:Uncharacterized protein n=1 Tax=Panagrolaimus sp. ES5 TaxID=591445 RepID=A0AC34FIG5_9BILA
MSSLGILYKPKLTSLKYATDAFLELFGVVLNDLFDISDVVLPPHRFFFNEYVGTEAGDKVVFEVDGLEVEHLLETIIGCVKVVVVVSRNREEVDDARVLESGVLKKLLFFGTF